MAHFYKYEKEAGDSQYLTILEEKTTIAKLLRDGRDQSGSLNLLEKSG